MGPYHTTMTPHPKEKDSKKGAIDEIAL